MYAVFVAVAALAALWYVQTRLRQIHVPGPLLFLLSGWVLKYHDYRGTRTKTIHALHEKYGPVVRIGPNEIDFLSLEALRAIYGAGNRFDRTPFYTMFKVAGEHNMFSVPGAKEHGARKRMLSSIYSNSHIIRHAAPLIEELAIPALLRAIDEQTEPVDVNPLMHWLSLDVATAFIYGEDRGTRALAGDVSHRAMLHDILDPSRKKWSWLAVHLPNLPMHPAIEKTLVQLRVMPPRSRPAFSAIREYSQSVVKNYSSADSSNKVSVIDRLSAQPTLSRRQVDSECADHLLAGVETTANTLMFLVWALSQPASLALQQEVRKELDVESFSLADLQDEGKFPLFNAVLMETLRLYASLPASEPRVATVDQEVAGVHVKAGTICTAQAWSFHRDPNVFPQPHEFNPKRWLLGSGSSPEQLLAMHRNFWAFSSGSRMCIGMQ